MSRYITLVPAYGRDYKSATAVLADWKSGKDFEICDLFSGSNGRYVNANDVANYPELASATFNVRFCRQTKITVIRPKKR